MTNFILPDLLYQVALYWSPGDLQEDGERDYDSVTPIEIPCHWSHTHSETVDLQGEVYLSSATVQTSTPILRRGVLWLSTAKVSDVAGTALSQVPATIPMNQIIQNVKVIPDVQGEEILYEAML